MNSDASDTTLCPFCQQSNRCGIKQPANCWCVDIEIPAALINLLPIDLQHKACICLSCVEAYHRDPNAFKSTTTNNH